MYGERMKIPLTFIVKKKEKPYYKKVFKQRLLGSGFVYFLKGNGIYTDKNGERIPFKQNDFLLVEYGMPYSIEADNCEIEYVTTAFSLDKRDSFSSFGLPTFFSADDDDLRIKVLTLLNVWERNSVYSRIESRLLLNEIFLEIRKNFEGETPRDDFSPVKNAVMYINRNYDKEITITKLAQICLMSESYFRQMFKKYMGSSPLKYRENVRVSWAKKYLKSNLFSVSEIAEKLGYCDIYHFSKVFKVYVGISPSQYRAKKICIDK